MYFPSSAQRSLGPCLGNVLLWFIDILRLSRLWTQWFWGLNLGPCALDFWAISLFHLYKNYINWAREILQVGVCLALPGLFPIFIDGLQALYLVVLWVNLESTTKCLFSFWAIPSTAQHLLMPLSFGTIPEGVWGWVGCRTLVCCMHSKCPTCCVITQVPWF